MGGGTITCSDPTLTSGSVVIAPFEEGSYTLPGIAVRRVLPGGRTDTLLFPLGTPAENGTRQWAGHAYSNHYDITRRYRNGIRYTQPGEYALSIRQLSGADTLRGILSLGVIAHGVRPAALP